MTLRKLQELAGITNGKYVLQEAVPGYYDEDDFSHLPPASKLLELKPLLAKAAQAVYNQWQQNETGYCDIQMHSGGICHTIADAHMGVLYDAGFEEVTTFNASIGENHVWVMVATSNGVYEVDIPPHVYETGGGYTWKKIPDVLFEPDDVVIKMISSDPADIKDYIGDY